MRAGFIRMSQLIRLALEELDSDFFNRVPGATGPHGRPPPTLCRWRDDCEATAEARAKRLHRPCVGGATTVQLQNHRHSLLDGRWRPG
jgi:hypothetical protein